MEVKIIQPTAIRQGVVRPMIRGYWTWSSTVTSLMSLSTKFGELLKLTKQRAKYINCVGTRMIHMNCFFVILKVIIDSSCVQ